MNMFKKLAAVGMFAMFAIAPFQAYAAFGFVTDAATVDDVTTTACTTASGQSVSMFGGGVDMDQVWALEVEVGSKGSGTFESVSGFTDVFPTVVGAAATGGPTQIARIIEATPTAAAAFTTRTGTEIEAALPATVATGDCFYQTIINLATVAGRDITLTAAATGVTLVGDMVVDAQDADGNNAVGLFLYRRTGSNAITIYRVG